jgi:hypothetical protein
MSRKKRPADDAKRAKVRSRSFRASSRHNKNKTPKDVAIDDSLWLKRSRAHFDAMKILNNHTERPYWMSIPHGQYDGVEPVAGFFPCSTFRTAERVYYGFLFREHRDRLFELWDDVLKETLASVAVARKLA